MTALLAVQAVATLALVGLVWFVQVVHYPLFARVPHVAFPEYEREHARRTTWVVAPLMTAEAFCAILVLALGPSPATAGGVVLLGVVWASTLFLQVPCHRVLATRWDASIHERLALSNWIRTLAWSGRGAIAVGLLV